MNEFTTEEINYLVKSLNFLMSDPKAIEVYKIDLIKASELRSKLIIEGQSRGEWYSFKRVD